MKPESAAKGTRILCANCGQVIVVTEEMLDIPMACAACGTAINYLAYEPLAEILERRAAEEKARTDKEKASIEIERQNKKMAAKIERLNAMRAREEERQRLDSDREARKAEEYRQRQGRGRVKQSTEARNAAYKRANTKMGTFGALLVCMVMIAGSVIAGLIGVAAMNSAKLVMDDILGTLWFLIAAVLFTGAMVYQFCAYAAHRVSTKVECVCDEIKWLRASLPDIHEAKLGDPTADPPIPESLGFPVILTAPEKTS